MFRLFLNRFKSFASAKVVYSVAFRRVLTTLPNNIGTLSVLAIAGTSLYAGNSIVFCESNDKLSVNDFSDYLVKGLKETREKMTKAGRDVPRFNMKQMTFENGLLGHWLELKFEPQCNVLGLSEHLLSILISDPKHLGIHLRNVNDFYADAKGLEMSIESEDGKSYIAFQKKVSPVEKTNKKRMEVSIEMFKNGGFTKSEAQAVVQGYIEGFSVEKALKKPISFGFDTNLLNNKGTQSHFGTDAVQPADPALEKLEKLGVEVFDKKSNALLTWDSLAGYESVKRLIQDTIVNALQYPEIYDRVAAQTRVVFESNRPKAVLFEGPPGTGKTLTARILASQCDRPLVVIRMESIMSKWYGESEKKFGQILDACDELDGAIVFVDEIDSLAPSRDAEEGIHEASKRVLSILLQRIEGFHGKGRSVLVCATNRKQDLDAALLSRFDLMIQYPLPDYHTRGEIFKRYAKQFSVLAGDYAVLARSTEGFSCRSIKEVCEQAERMCAGRLVAAQIQKDKNSSNSNSSTNKKASSSFWGIGSSSSGSSSVEAASEAPVMSDYMECIEMHKRANDIKMKA